MLPKISNALSQFLAPVASSLQRNPKRERQSQKQKQDQPSFSKTDISALRVVQPPPPEDATPPTTLPAPTTSGQKPSTVSAAFLQLMNLIRSGRERTSRWRGSQAYHTEGKGQGRAGKFKKGTMLDKEAS